MTPSQPLSRLATFVNGRAFRPEEMTQSGLPVLRIRQLVDPDAEFDFYDGPVDVRHQVNNGDLIFSWSATLATRLWDRGPAILNQHLFNVHPQSGVDKAWLRWAIEASLTTFRGMMHGSAMTHITTEMLRDVKIAVPAVEDQRRIADFLDNEVARLGSIASARHLQQRLIEDRFASLWAERVLALDTPARWVPLRRILVGITDGPFGSSLTSAHYAFEGARVIRLGNLGRACFRPADEAYIPMGYYEELRDHAVEPGDLLVAGLGDENHPLGRACVAPNDLGPAIVKADCFRIRLDPEKVSHSYAAWALSSPPVTAETQLISRGATRARINTAIARDLRIPMPDAATQTQFVDQISRERSAADVAAAAFSRSLALMEERKQALITAAVTGQLDVTTARAVA